MTKTTKSPQTNEVPQEFLTMNTSPQVYTSLSALLVNDLDVDTFFDAYEYLPQELVPVPACWEILCPPQTDPGYENPYQRFARENEERRKATLFPRAPNDHERIENDRE